MATIEVLQSGLSTYRKFSVDDGVGLPVCGTGQKLAEKFVNCERAFLQPPLPARSTGIE